MNPVVTRHDLDVPPGDGPAPGAAPDDAPALDVDLGDDPAFGVALGSSVVGIGVDAVDVARFRRILARRP
jgi:hypothetical protein